MTHPSSVTVISGRTMTEPTEKVLEQLPVFPDVTPDGEWRSLRVEGLVATRLDLGQGDLTALGVSVQI